MVIKLQRLTTEYILIEDRIRISGDTRDAGPVVLWLTNRLAMRAVPQLLRWLEDQAAPTTGSSSDSPVLKRELQSFAQAAAVAGLTQHKPVIAEAGTPSWIVKAIDITATQGRLSMTFRGEQDQSASLRFDATGLRQWLSILHRAWSKAQWPSLVWPDWIKRDEFCRTTSCGIEGDGPRETCAIDSWKRKRAASRPPFTSHLSASTPSPSTPPAPPRR